MWFALIRPYGMPPGVDSRPISPLAALRRYIVLQQKVLSMSDGLRFLPVGPVSMSMSRLWNRRLRGGQPLREENFGDDMPCCGAGWFRPEEQRHLLRRRSEVPPRLRILTVKESLAGYRRSPR